MQGDNPYVSLERLATVLERIAPALERIAVAFEASRVEAATGDRVADCLHTGDRIDFGDDWICLECGWRQSLGRLIPIDERVAMAIPIVQEA